MARGLVSGPLAFLSTRTASDGPLTNQPLERPDEFPGFGLSDSASLSSMDDEMREFLHRVRSLVDEYRGTCLWFMAADFYPESTDQIRRTLDQIEKHGDRRGFQEAARLKQWLLRNSSEPSVA